MKVDWTFYRFVFSIKGDPARELVNPLLNGVANLLEAAIAPFIPEGASLTKEAHVTVRSDQVKAKIQIFLQIGGEKWILVEGDSIEKVMLLYGKNTFDKLDEKAEEAVQAVRAAWKSLFPNGTVATY